MGTNGEFFYLTLQEFPQPSRPSQYAYGTRMEYSSTPEEQGYSNQYFDTFQDFEEPEEQIRYVNDDDLQQMFRGFVEEIDEKGHEMLKKMFSKVEKDVPFERVFRETLQDYRGRPVSDMFEKFLSKLNPGPVNDPASMDRGLDRDSEDLKHKLDRFKRVKPNTEERQRGSMPIRDSKLWRGENVTHRIHRVNLGLTHDEIDRVEYVRELSMA
ncbi:Uncharacterized protein Fot_36478 [Forsythia ovata]|uniref:Uncharacterized protein n=1 Tax=Forsythia ovata TaxID=205694 RepID=A0ABD1SPH6_9LAMI